jgi:hypothetical protein
MGVNSASLLAAMALRALSLTLTMPLLVYGRTLLSQAAGAGAIAAATDAGTAAAVRVRCRVALLAVPTP